MHFSQNINLVLCDAEQQLSFLFGVWLRYIIIITNEQLTIEQTLIP